jgi:hypothetical protein
MKLAVLLSLLAFGSAAGVGVYLHGENADLKERLAALEVEGGGSVTSSGDPTAPGLRGAAARRDVAELKGVTDSLMTRMESLELVAKTAAASPAAAGDGTAAGLTDKPAFAEAVRDVVLDMATNDVDFRSRVGVNDRTKVPKNSPFSKVADTLQLDASQESQMSKDLQEMQQDLFTLLAEEREDGVIPMEIIAKAEELKQGDPRRAEHFVKLFTLKIPGSQETYMQRAVKLTQGFRKKADRYLRPQQKEILTAVEIDWFSIKFN